MTTIRIEDTEKLQPGTFVFVDIRGTIAYAHGHIPGAVCWSEEELPDSLPRDKMLIIYCSIGEKSAPVALALRDFGYDAYSLEDGFRAWLMRSGGELTPAEIQRYDRQITLPQVGSEGQKKLKHARVLIIGAGGLGAPAAMYLAAAGVGTIGIADADKVDLSNLQRQIIHGTGDVGRAKVESARETINAMNPDVTVHTYQEFVSSKNIMDLIRDYDFIIDGTDNFPAKFLINDACVMARKPFSHAGIIRFQGQLMTYVPEQGPCYRCIFQSPPPKDAVPTCKQAGVIGAMGGVIGSLQAMEAVKYLLGVGELLVGRLLTYDALKMEFRTIKLPKKPKYGCAVCGDHPTITELIDYEQAECSFK